MTEKSNITESENQSFYNEDSKKYDAGRWDTKGGKATNKAQQELLQDICADWNNKHVLEIGPGTARFTIPILRKQNRMTLTDLSPGMLEVAKKNIEEAGLIDQVEHFVEGSIYELPFEDNSFDHAISLNVFNHLEHPDQALKQMARVIKPGSTLLFNYANLQSYYWPAARKINKNHTAVGQNVYSTWERPADMKRIISEAGLSLVRKLGNVHVPRGLEKYHLKPVIMLLDKISRSGPLKRFAPFHFCLCRKER